MKNKLKVLADRHQRPGIDRRGTNNGLHIEE